MRILVTGHGVDATDSPLRFQAADPLRFLGHEVLAVAPTESAVRWGLDRHTPEMPAYARNACRDSVRWGS